MVVWPPGRAVARNTLTLVIVLAAVLLVLGVVEIGVVMLTRASLH